MGSKQEIMEVNDALMVKITTSDEKTLEYSYSELSRYSKVIKTTFSVDMIDKTNMVLEGMTGYKSALVVAFFDILLERATFKSVIYRTNPENWVRVCGFFNEIADAWAFDSFYGLCWKYLDTTVKYHGMVETIIHLAISDVFGFQDLVCLYVLEYVTRRFTIDTGDKGSQDHHKHLVADYKQVFKDTDGILTDRQRLFIMIALKDLEPHFEYQYSFDNKVSNDRYDCTKCTRTGPSLIGGCCEFGQFMQ